uniref:hypothetical protein n=1 Tax=Clostridium sp. NkU-1 TaxID=1095009 RepID=UPI0006D1078E
MGTAQIIKGNKLIHQELLQALWTVDHLLMKHFSMRKADHKPPEVLEEMNLRSAAGFQKFCLSKKLDENLVFSA